VLDTYLKYKSQSTLR